MNEPESRNEAILQNILGASNVLETPESRIEVLLMALLEELKGGSSGAVVVDNALSLTSENPVQNKVVSSQLMGMIAGYAVNQKTGSMEVWSGDLNNLTASGFYNALTCKNAPGQYLNLLVIGYYLEGYCTQIAIDVTTGNIKKRSQINGTWNDWSDL